ncbi:polysaccharide pyruvyl transferase family protein [Marinivivus vitaminiproducens]|uniref:polysaccharide pyruvyl transferase family protein n=1 Tax=Marinivivus vitaminiproducens TaxID=3035935 RepID=UPI0027A5F3F8|nr:polysaccharide pyruvyl transferase family protein [Geminicoccaceae bacterium SCSIO 64248]
MDTTGRKSFLLFGYLGGRNLGDDAMLSGFFSAAPEKTDFVVLARDKDEVKIPTNRTVKVLAANFFEAMKQIIRSDGVIRVGGTSFHDEYKIKSNLRMKCNYAKLMFMYLLPWLLRKKIAAIGIGAGTPLHWWTKFTATLSFRACRLIIARDRASARILNNLTGGHNVLAGVDLAFLDERDLCNRTMPGVIGVSVLDLSPFMTIGYGSQLDFWEEVIKRTAERSAGKELRIFAFKDNDSESDLIIAKELERRMGGLFDQVSVVGYADGLERILNDMSACDTFVATRYHSAIFASLMGMKMVIVPYNEKLLHLVDDLAISPEAVIDLGHWSRTQELGAFEPTYVNPARANDLPVRVSDMRHAIAKFFA